MKRKHFSLLLGIFLMMAVLFTVSPKVKAATDITSLPSSAGDYRLTTDITISSTWDVPSGNTTLDLNGYGIKRTGSGRVINILSGATLTLCDSNASKEHKFTISNAFNGAGLGVVNDSLTDNYQVFTGGYITGGNMSSGLGGGIYVDNGSLVMNGGTLIGNTAKHGGGIRGTNGNVTINDGSKIIYNTCGWQGAGIMIAGSSATLKIYGGEITHNKSDGDSKFHSGGVSFCGGNFYLHGSPLIMGNYGGFGNGEAKNRVNNICLEVKLTIDGTLTNTEPIGITMNIGGFNGTTRGEFTKGSTTYNEAAKFSSDVAAYGILKNETTKQLMIDPTVTNYTVTYNANSGSGSITDINSPYATGSNVKTLANGFTAPTGYSFSGWNTEADGTGTACAAGGTFTITADTVLYAQWTPIYTITYYLNGGTASNPTSYTVESNITTLNHPTKKGYEFSGWRVISTEGNWLGTPDFGTTNFTTVGKYGNVTLQALYTLKTYNVTIIDTYHTTEGNDNYYTGTSGCTSVGGGAYTHSTNYTGTYNLTKAAINKNTLPVATAGAEFYTFDRYLVTTVDNASPTNWVVGETYIPGLVGKYGDVTLTAVYKIKADIVALDYAYGNVKNDGKYVLTLVGFKGQLTAHQTLQYNHANAGATANYVSLYKSKNATYASILNQINGKKWNIPYTVNEGTTEMYVCLIKLDSAVQGATAVSGSGSSATIANMDAFIEAVRGRLAVNTTEEQTNIELDQDGNVNGAGAVDVGDIGAVSTMLSDSAFYTASGVSLLGRLKADVDSSDGNYKFGSIKDVIWIIDKLLGLL